MILVDTSVWIEHLRREDEALAECLALGGVLGHPFVIGELAVGALRDRDRVVADLALLPPAPCAREEDVLEMVDQQRLYGRGLSYIDVHLLASTLLLPGTRLWSRDRRLRAAAEELRIAAPHN